MRHNKTEHQFEFQIDDQVAFVEYFTEGQKIYLTHTEVPQSLRGNGIASELIRQTLGYIKKQHWILVPQCSFVVAYVNDHPEWHSILSEGYQM
ncbi:GNAT family N-acetyltransferase [Flavobacterium sp.]|uniref:GNAT family N-acetyltransferase n=1 Tax=Flavobacterium sp. TaxID=239 RepID=UPI0039E2C2C0